MATREDAGERLANLFFQRCKQIEQRIIHRAKDEKEGIVDNFDFGLGVEDIFREELSKLLTARYSVRCGTVGLGNHTVSIPSSPEWFLAPGVRPEVRDPESPLNG